MSVEALAEAAMALSGPDRARLVETLVETLEVEEDSQVRAQWLAEARRRRDEVRLGHVQPIPGEQALEQVRKLLVR